MCQILLHDVGTIVSRYKVSEERLVRLLEGSNNKIHFTFDDGYCSVGSFLEKRTLFMSQSFLFVVAGKPGRVNDWDQTGELAGQKLMDWEQIKTLHDFGAKIGSHGLNHLDLTKLPDRELEKELKESKRLIEEKINAPVESLAYPFGYFNDRVIAAVKAAGYKEAYTTCDSLLQGRGNPFRKRRIEITGTEPDWLVTTKMNGIYDLRVMFELPKLVIEKTWLMLNPR